MDNKDVKNTVFKHLYILNSSVKNNQSIKDKAEQLVRHYQIPFAKSKKDALDIVFLKIQNQNIQHKKLTSRKIQLKHVISVAASFAIILSAYFYLASISIKSNNLQTLSYRLPDNSRVVLQKNSELSFKKYAWNRNVKIKGAAYFEVEKGNKFIVNANDGKVEVLGTRFLVEEFPEGLQVKCYEGKVKASFNGNSYVLTQGTQVLQTLKKENKSEMLENTDFPEFALFSGNYSEKPLSIVLNEVADFYQVEIKIKAGNERRFSGAINSGSLINTVEIICTSMQLNYRFLDQTILEIY